MRSRFLALSTFALACFSFNERFSFGEARRVDINYNYRKKPIKKFVLSAKQQKARDKNKQGKKARKINYKKPSNIILKNKSKGDFKDRNTKFKS